MITKKHAILIDGSSIIYRAFHGFPDLTLPDGKPVGALFGFCSMLVSILNNHKYDLFCVVLDSARETSFRTKIYKEYKAHRPPTPDSLKEQFPLIIKACEALGIPTIKKAGFEADDLIATYTCIFSRNSITTKIIGVDKDLMQLINNDVYMYDPIKIKEIRSDDVFKKYGIFPHQMTHFQAIVGDASDNIPGVKGVGPVTAAKLLKKYENLHGIYKNIQHITPTKMREKLEINQKNAELSLQLATLDRNVNVDSNFQKLKVKYNRNQAIDFLENLGFKSIIKKLPIPSRLQQSLI